MNEIEKPMYYGATASTFEKARQLRNRMTQEEIILWKRLKGKQICNVRFRRQHPINTYIADFYCHEAKLVIELDGKIHLRNKEHNKERTLIIKNFNIQIVRFWNNEIIADIEEIIHKITLIVNERLDFKAII